MKYKFLFLVIGGLAFACGSKKEQNTKKVEANERSITAFNDTTFVWSYMDCHPDSSDCTYIRYRYPNFSGNEPLNGLIQSSLFSWDVSNREQENQKTPAELCAEFQKDYENFLQETGNQFKEVWYFDQDISISAQRGAILCLNIWTEEFSGGAHGMLGRKMIWIDITSNSEISKDSLFSNPKDPALLKMVELAFRSESGMELQTPWAEAGFTFKNDVFHLPEVIGLTEQGIVFYYSKYEVAPYAMGDIEVIIPLEKILSFFSGSVRNRLDSQLSI